MQQHRTKVIQGKDSLEEHLKFEALLADLSTKLVNLSLEEIDAAIEDSIRAMLSFFDADRCHIGVCDEKTSEIKVVYYQARPGINIPPVTGISTTHLSYLYEQLMNGKTVVCEKLSDMPSRAKQDADLLRKTGIRSFVIFPLKISKEIRFGLSMATVRSQRKWDLHTVDHIKIIGNLLANVLQRKLVLEQIAEEKAWNEAVWQKMPQILYVFDEEGRLLRWNKNAERIFGYTAEEMRGRYITSFSVQKYHASIMEAAGKVYANGEERFVETTYITKSGRRFPVYGTGSLVEIGGKKYLIGLAVDLTDLKKAQKKIEAQLQEIKRLKKQLEAENLYLRQELNLNHSFSEIVGESNILKYSLYRLEQVAPTDSTVLLEGETGTGKELFARALHQLSKRKDKPLITVNCAAMPANLFESELFGHEKGAFTGAIRRKTGRFELADGGTVFLDEVSEMPLELQAKLLRVLQEGEFERVGSTRTIKVDVRVIAATNRDLEKAVKEGRFRKDLFYRLNVYPITIAPLRERLSDIPLLVDHFVRRFNRKFAKNITTIPKKIIERLQHYSWPGNIRELENVIERAVILSKTNVLAIEPLNDPHFENETAFKPLAEFEREYIIKVLEHTYWRVDGPQGAARILEMHPETLRSRMRKLNIRKPTRHP